MLHQKSLFTDSYNNYKFPKTQYLGSKEKLVDWIFQAIPNNINNIFDAFSGSSVLGYYFKTRGYKVYSNDFLKCNSLIATALIENSKVTLEKQDIKILFDENIESDNFIERIFTGVFFERNQSIFLDKFRANVNRLDNYYKKALALVIVNRALTRKITLGHFAHLSALKYSKDPNRIKRNPNLVRPIKNIFLDLIESYNSSIFNNKKNNHVFCGDTVEIISELKDIDLVYFDPPYCGCHPDYQAFYHFLETFVQYWTDKSFINGTKMYYPKKESGFTKKSKIEDSFQRLFSNSQHIPYWLISYNSKSYPDYDSIIKLIKEYKKVKTYKYRYSNHYGGRGSRKDTVEYLFYCYN